MDLGDPTQSFLFNSLIVARALLLQLLKFNLVYRMKGQEHHKYIHGNELPTGVISHLFAFDNWSRFTEF